MVEVVVAVLLVVGPRGGVATAPEQLGHRDGNPDRALLPGLQDVRRGADQVLRGETRSTHDRGAHSNNALSYPGCLFL